MTNQSYQEIEKIYLDFKQGLSFKALRVKYGKGKSSILTLVHRMEWINNAEPDGLEQLCKYGLSTRCFNSLRRFGIKNIPELIDVYRNSAIGDLLTTRNFGAVSLNEVEAALEKWLGLPEKTVGSYFANDIESIDKQIEVLRQKIDDLERKKASILQGQQTT